MTSFKKVPSIEKNDLKRSQSLVQSHFFLARLLKQHQRDAKITLNNYEEPQNSKNVRQTTTRITKREEKYENQLEGKGNEHK